MKAYRVKNGPSLYEVAETRKLRGLKWVKLLNKQDGKGYRRLLSMKDGHLAYLGWVSILQVASKCPERWTLADEDGPLDAEDLFYKTGIPAQCFELAFEYCVHPRIGWLEQIEIGRSLRPVAESGGHWRALGESGGCREKVGGIGGHQEALGDQEGNRMEGNKKENKEEISKISNNEGPVRIACILGEEFSPSPELLAEYEQRFPNLNVEKELRGLERYSRENSNRRRSIRDVRAWISNCLKKASRQRDGPARSVGQRSRSGGAG